MAQIIVVQRLVKTELYVLITSTLTNAIAKVLTQAKDAIWMLTPAVEISAKMELLVRKVQSLDTLANAEMGIKVT